MRDEPLLRLHGLADNMTELCICEDYVASITYRTCLIFRKRIAKFMRYPAIRRILVRDGPRYATLRLEDSHGQVINIIGASPAEMQQAGMLISERIYRAHVNAEGSPADGMLVFPETLAALHERGLLTDAYFAAKQQEA
ncbi:MAG TPA: hypothetical protein VK066_16210 [Chloroflexota bacterium]|nr:hypothetical protein [Chloroflexota bacterium]